MSTQFLMHNQSVSAKLDLHSMNSAHLADVQDAVSEFQHTGFEEGRRYVQNNY